MRKWLGRFCAVMLLVFFVAMLCHAAVSATEKKKQQELLRQLELFSDSLAILQEEYVEEIKPKDLIYSALKGMLAGLDPHSQFLDPDSYNELKVDTEGKFGGLGIEITVKDDLLTVITPMQDGPAWRAGVKAGDRIVKIEGKLTKGFTISDAVKQLRGKPGTEVAITVLRESENKLIDFKVVREMIKIKDIKQAKILEDGIAYIQLVEFRENTPRELQLVLKELENAGMQALIMDLRNNPGGLLDTAAEVTGKFLPKGKLIISTKGRKENQNMQIFSREAKPYLDLPLVVLVNEGSASGSEIFAGALQDYKRAIILGMKTFGKGSVQTVVPLSDGSALRITTSKYFTPNGRVIHNEGITPDVITEQPEPVEKKPKETPEEKPKDIFNELEKKGPSLPPSELLKEYRDDAQLMRALDILKAIRVYKDSLSNNKINPKE